MRVGATRFMFADTNKVAAEFARLRARIHDLEIAMACALPGWTADSDDPEDPDPTWGPPDHPDD